MHDSEAQVPLCPGPACCKNDPHYLRPDPENPRIPLGVRGTNQSVLSCYTYVVYLNKSPCAPAKQALKLTDNLSLRAPKSPATAMIDFARINAAALSALPAIMARWLPDGRRCGREYV